MADPYKILGVDKSATQDEIRKAYRKLAKDTHPDLNPGNADAERRFKEISAANEILGDPDKRKRFDAGEIDESGAEMPERRFYREYAEADPNMRYGGARSAPFGTGEAFDAEDLFADLFRRRAEGARGWSAEGARGWSAEGARGWSAEGARGWSAEGARGWSAEGAPGSRGEGFRGPGGDVHYTLPVAFLDAVNGARKTVAMPDGKTLDIEIPSGFREGQILRLKGQGRPGSGGEPGDAYVEVHILPHDAFRRDGDDIRSVVPISLGEALNGASVRVDTVDGAVDVKVPKRTKSGTTLRLRGKGVRRDKAGARGDHLIELVIVPPENPDDELAALMADWEAKHPQHPRQKRGERT